MEQRIFIKKFKADWNELEEILQNINKRKFLKKNKSLTSEKIDALQLAYQKVSHHLSYSQTNYPDQGITSYLNELVAKAHRILYQDQITSFLQLKDFFSKTFIKLLHEQKRFVLVAALLFLIGAVGGFLAVYNDPLNLYTLLPPEISHNIDPGQLGKSTNLIDSPTVSASIMTNNIQVAFMAFLGGITLGLFTVYILFNNGVIIGALFAVFLEYGKAYDFWAFIVPHGMIELTAIFIAGGSGLLMGYKILVPGSYARSYQIKKQGLRSVQLLLGTIPLFIIAGVIEGYLTPAAISLELKYAFAGLTIIALILYFWAGKRRLG